MDCMACSCPHCCSSTSEVQYSRSDHNLKLAAHPYIILVLPPSIYSLPLTGMDGKDFFPPLLLPPNGDAIYTGGGGGGGGSHKLRIIMLQLLPIYNVLPR